MSPCIAIAPGGPPELGAAGSAMVLGHWYLVDKAMSLAPLRRLTALFAASVAARGASLSALVAARPEVRGSLGGSAEAFLAGPGLALAMAAAFGLVLPAVLAAGVWGTLRVPNAQSATGILYAAVVSAIIGDLAVRGAGV